MNAYENACANVHDLIGALPDIATLRDRCRAMAALELVISGNTEGGFFSYDPAWGPGEEAAFMDNGSGDEYAIVFTADGVFGRGFDHESPMSPWGVDDVELWPGLVEGVPEAFRPLVTEPSFCVEEGVLQATVVFWRETGDTAWRAGDVEFPAGRTDADGTRHLFGVLAAGTPQAYRAFAEDYYETTLPLEAVQHLWDLRPLTREAVTALNPGLPLEVVVPRLVRAGYPGV
ncbi:MULTISPECIES: hypothetical protein [unclassified Streptomyces]|uniref:hypothetical protein n=1 Tax=unclassified Streptomyces TaxID=2593676 RepID=UPI002253969A|nr:MULTISPECIES: hypothetical protein [unclassified Streptomyces]MCX4526559.1 hypothetical protein [Streptomyces sp. NBC_01551]MCX4542878.1 hypothetical protein [Streptomyces sp. NBC_01565]